MQTLLELVRGSYSLLDLTEFRTGILHLVRQAVPCALVAYNELEPATERGVSLFEPAEAMIFDDPGALLARVGPSSPIVTRFARTRDGRAYKLSDFLTQRELHETPLWQDALGPLGVEYQMAFALPSQPSVLVGITLNDGDRDFSERDRTLLNLARPQLVQAHRNAQIHTEAARDWPRSIADSKPPVTPRSCCAATAASERQVERRSACSKRASAGDRAPAAGCRPIWSGG